MNLKRKNNSINNVHTEWTKLVNSTVLARFNFVAVYRYEARNPLLTIPHTLLSNKPRKNELHESMDY